MHPLPSLKDVFGRPSGEQDGLRHASRSSRLIAHVADHVLLCWAVMKAIVGGRGPSSDAPRTAHMHRFHTLERILMNPFLLLAVLAVVAFLYASVGHGGASGYLAIVALLGYSQDVMRPRPWS